MAEANGGVIARQQQPARWARGLLLIAAMIEFLGGLGGLPILAGNLAEVPGPGLGGAIIIATIILRPIAAGAALFYLVRGQLPGALVSMAIAILLTWLSYLPSIAREGLNFQEDGAGGVFTFAMIILPPILVLAITGLALTGRRLTLATLLAVLPTLIGVLGVVAFGIGVAIYGF